jgi:hypothetical protein
LFLHSEHLTLLFRQQAAVAAVARLLISIGILGRAVLLGETLAFQVLRQMVVAEAVSSQMAALALTVAERAERFLLAAVGQEERAEAEMDVRIAPQEALEAT